MKFSCPKCKSKIEIQKTFNKKMHVSCGKCGIEDILEFSKNFDEIFLEFLSRYDKGLVSEKGLSENLKDEGIVRGENEIKEMIGENKPDKITEEILFSKKDY
ncbi:MAG: DEAD/DEAH box helicase, partial [Nitrosopumilus sp.]